MGRRNYNDWYDEEYERMCQEADVAPDDEIDRRKTWVFWTPVKVALVEIPVVFVLGFLLSLAGVGKSWLMGFVVAPMTALMIWGLQIDYTLHNYGKDGVWRRFWQWHVVCLIVIVPLFGFHLWLLFAFLFVVGVFLNLMLGHR